MQVPNKKLVFAPSTRLILSICLPVIVGACTEVPTDLAPVSGSPAAEILDAAHGNAPISFEAPLSRASGIAGNDRAVSPVVEICRLASNNCATPLVARYTSSTGVGGEVVNLVDNAAAYLVNWQTDQFQLEVGATYRIAVLVRRTELGHADVVVYGSGKDAKNATTGEYFGLTNGRTLPIRFRIPPGRVAVISSTGGAASFADGEAKLVFSAGALPDSTTVIATPVVASDVTDTSILPGTQFEFSPSPITFGAPVTLTLGYPAVLPEHSHADRLVVCKMSETACIPVPGSVANTATNSVTATLSGFSKYAGTELPTITYGINTIPPYGHAIFLHTPEGEKKLAIGDGMDLTNAWSKDGSKLVYTARVGCTGEDCNLGPTCEHNDCQFEIRVVNEDGSNERVVVGPGNYGPMPSWSPDGTHIVYTSHSDHAYHIIEAGGTNDRKIVLETEEYPAKSAIYSPDGEHIALMLEGTVVIVDKNGNNPVYMPADYFLAPFTGPNISWSTDSNRLAFLGYDPEGIAGVIVINKDGSNGHVVARGDWISEVVWSPVDANLLLFTQYSVFDNYASRAIGFYVVQADGTGERNIFADPAAYDYDLEAGRWSPDGKRVFFLNRGVVYVINLDGSGLQVIQPTTPGVNNRPAWQP